VDLVCTTWREVGQEVAVSNAAEGLALAGATVHGSPPHGHTCVPGLLVDVILLVEGDVDSPPQRGLLDGGAPPWRARESRAAEDVNLPEPTQDLQQDVAGQCCPVMFLHRYLQAYTRERDYDCFSNFQHIYIQTMHDRNVPGFVSL
jgi:hypothetical protein